MPSRFAMAYSTPAFADALGWQEGEAEEFVVRDGTRHIPGRNARRHAQATPDGEVEGPPALSHFSSLLHDFQSRQPWPRALHPGRREQCGQLGINLFDPRRDGMSSGPTPDR